MLLPFLTYSMPLPFWTWKYGEKNVFNLVETNKPPQVLVLSFCLLEYYHNVNKECKTVLYLHDECINTY